MKYAVFSLFYPGERNSNLALIICAKNVLMIFFKNVLEWKPILFDVQLVTPLGVMSNIYMQRVPIL